MKQIKKKDRYKTLKILGIIFICFSMMIVTLLYGPWHGFRDFWITTAMTTLNHQYLAKWFYSEDTINKVLAENRVIPPDEDTKTDLIEINDTKSSNIVYKDEYDKQVLEHNEGDIYKYFKVEGYNFDAYMAVIYDPSRIHVVTSKY